MSLYFEDRGRNLIAARHILSKMKIKIKKKDFLNYSFDVAIGQIGSNYLLFNMITDTVYEI